MTQADFGRGILPLLERNSIGLSTSATRFRRNVGNFEFVRRLEKQVSLEGHTGCVNTISWSDSGDLLLSGSDDCTLNIYDVWQQKLLYSVQSGHRSNILSACFLPCSSDRKVVSCSGDGVVQYNDVMDKEKHGNNGFNCHVGTAYQVDVIPGDPNVFMSCGEDGTVMKFDLRVKTSCPRRYSSCRENAVIQNRFAVSAISVNPVMPYYLAIASGDGWVKIFDQRQFTTAAVACGGSAGDTDDSWSRFRPMGHALGDQARITSLAYNPKGDELMVSYCSDYIYLYAMDFERDEVENDLATLPPRTHSSDVIADPPSKRLRLRGDWSDTGPDARPLSERSSSDGSTSDTVMQRMTSLFSTWLDDTIESNEVPGHPSAGNESTPDATGRDVTMAADGGLTPRGAISQGLVVLSEEEEQQRKNEAATKIQTFFRTRKQDRLAKTKNSSLPQRQPRLLMCFKGHRNSRTMIQKARFWGDSYVISGSDCGRVFIWRKSTGRLTALFLADKHVVNCVQPHPSTQVLATSGIDYNVKIWAPTARDPTSLAEADEVMRRNALMLSESRGSVTVPASFMLRMLTSLGRIRGQRRERHSESDTADGVETEDV